MFKYLCGSLTTDTLPTFVVPLKQMAINKELIFPYLTFPIKTFKLLRDVFMCIMHIKNTIEWGHSITQYKMVL